MGGESADENPYAFSAGAERATANSGKKPISVGMYFYQYIIACFAFFLFLTIFYGLLMLFLVRDLLDSWAGIPVHVSVYVLAFLLARLNLRSSLARLALDDPDK